MGANSTHFNTIDNHRHNSLIAVQFLLCCIATFHNTLQQALHPTVNSGGWQVLTAYPHKGNGNHLIGWQRLCKHRFPMPIGLAQLTLHPIPVYGMLEVLLRNANEHLYWRLPVQALTFHIYGSQREGCQGMAVASTKEFIYQFLTDDSLLFSKHCRSRHTYII